MRFCVLAVLVSATVSVAPASAALTIGSNLEGGGDTGACAFSGPGERSCTIAQQTLAAPQLTAANGLLSPHAGIVTRWRLRTGNPAPGTKEVQARLRVIDGEEGGARTPYVELPLSEPGIHSFPAHLAIEPGQGVGLDLRIEGNGLGEASAPLLREIEGQALGEWEPQLGVGSSRAPERTQPDRALLLSADVNDDQQSPRTKLTYRPRQRFLGRGPVIVRVRCNERARVYASGQLELPNSTWGIYSVRKWVKRGKKVQFRLRVPRKARQAAAAAVARGNKVIAKVIVSATDPAGNESGSTVATIRAKR